MRQPSRRDLLKAALMAPARPPGLLIDTHVHLFAADVGKFPFAPDAPYRPAPAPLEQYVEFARQARIDHTVIVHPEPYQDDHRYLEYCLGREPSHGFFKGTCLFDPIAPDTPDRMEALVRKHPGRIVALRIHEMRKPGEPPLASGPIKDRDLASPAMRTTWQKAGQLGLAIQMHFLPHHAVQIGELARRFPNVPVILDHLARAGQGRPGDYARVLELERLPRVYMKYSGVSYSSKEKYPFRDVRPIVRQAFDAFGPDRMIWGGLGFDLKQFQQEIDLFETMFDFASAADRARIRGATAARLFAFS